MPEGTLNTLPTGIQFDTITIPIDPVLKKPFSKFYANSTASDGTIELKNTKAVGKTIRLLGTTGRIKIE